MEQLSADALPVGVVRVNADGAITEANDWFACWAGAPADELRGRPFSDVVIPADKDILRPGVGVGPWVMVHSADPGKAVMVTRHHSDGEDVLVLAEASDRFRAVMDLRRRYALADRTRTRLELVMDSSVAFSTAATEERLARVLADTAARAYRAEESSVHLRATDGDGTVLAAGVDGLRGAVDPHALVELVHHPRRVVRVASEAEGEALLPGLGAAMGGAGVRAFLAAPLHHEDAEFGVFAAWFRHERAFDDEAAPLAVALAGQAAQALATLRLQARLAHAATHDEVTDLPNRRLLEAQMDRFVGSTRCAVLFIDLDDFKRVNDRLGHQAGDRMLREVASRLQLGVREQDLVARYGGDEFVVVCELSEAADGVDIAERILDLLRGDALHAATRQALRASIGMTVAEAGTELTAEQLIRRADLAMYRAKTAGGDRIALARD
ncbi:diguanylate cyclase [Microbacterium sp. HJ5]